MRHRSFILLLMLMLLCPASADFSEDPNYKKADELLRSSKYVKAREIGERMLRVAPDSPEAQSILGRVHLHGEGNPGKGDYYLRKAHDTLVSKYSRPNGSNAPWRCYADTLWNLRLAAMELEDYEQAIVWANEYNDMYQPARPELLGWPLMKLERMDEAREMMEDALLVVKDKPEAVNSILNTMGAVEYEAGNFQASLDKFNEIIGRVKAGQGGMDPVYYSNAGETARDMLDFPAAEKHLLNATRYTGPFTYSTPWADLAELYIGQGRQPEAIQALRRHSRHLAEAEAGIQNQKRALSQRVLGMTLMACGYDLEAADLLENVALHGDRNSGTSTKRSLIRSRNQFFLREALKQKRERIREERSYSDLADWFRLYGQELALGNEMERARRECAALALGNGGPREMIPPYGPRGFNCPWLTPALGEVFGRGVISVEASRCLKDVPEQAAPYVKAILAEAKGDEDLMQAALDELPTSQVLLRGRLHALLGEESGSAQSLQQALEADPPVLRRLSISLPVEIDSADSTVASMLKSSPRFHKGKGFLLSIEGSAAGGFRGRFQGPDGSVLTRFNSEPGPNTDASRKNICQTIHQKVFAPRVNLTQSDINSLDGSNLASGHFRNQLQDLVGIKPKDSALENKDKQ